jgi:hypothetical protein
MPALVFSGDICPAPGDDYPAFQQLTLVALIRYNPNILLMVVFSCKKCGELNYLTPHAFWNVNDFMAITIIPVGDNIHGIWAIQL